MYTTVNSNYQPRGYSYNPRFAGKPRLTHQPPNYTSNPFAMRSKINHRMAGVDTIRTSNMLNLLKRNDPNSNLSFITNSLSSRVDQVKEMERNYSYAQEKIDKQNQSMY
ncbi:hypothetical protein A3Q56_03008 [Intoshia linei]|uniref:Uncharacterized protein n=1 Tax=Intoshia linei TaxID=1819745 RepID=A0A177B4Z7_9BILA|nr:hypothetical protein A3Q56_03008 [Intoshia linei]